MFMRWRYLVTLGILLCVLSSGTASQAALVTFRFTGEIGVVDSEITPARNYQGPPITGFVTYNTALVGLPLAVSLGPVTNITIVGAPTVHLATEGWAWPIPNWEGNGFELLYNTPGRIPLFPGIGVSPLGDRADLLILGVDTSGPGLNYTLHAPGSFNFSCVGGCGSTGYSSQGTLTSLSVVPLPPSVLLFGVGLVALVGLGAGSWLMSKAPAARVLSVAS